MLTNKRCREALLSDSSIDSPERKHLAFDMAEGSEKMQPVSEGISVSNEDLMNELRAIRLGQEDLKSALQQEIKNLREEMVERIDSRVSTMKKAVDKELVSMRSEINMIKKMETRVEKVEGAVNNVRPDDPEISFPTDRSIVVLNLIESANVVATDEVKNLLTDGLDLQNIDIVKAERTPGKNGKLGIVKVQFQTKEAKVNVLKVKKKLEKTENYKKVYLKGLMTHAERLIELNARTLLSQIPQKKDFRITSSGRIVSRNKRAPIDGNSAADNNDEIVE